MGQIAHRVGEVPSADRLITIQACSFVAGKAEADGNLDAYYDRVEAIMGLAGLILASRGRH